MEEREGVKVRDLLSIGNICHSFLVAAPVSDGDVSSSVSGDKVRDDANIKRMRGTVSMSVFSAYNRAVE